MSEIIPITQISLAGEIDLVSIRHGDNNQLQNGSETIKHRFLCLTLNVSSVYIGIHIPE